MHSGLKTAQAHSVFTVCTYSIWRAEILSLSTSCALLKSDSMFCVSLLWTTLISVSSLSCLFVNSCSWALWKRERRVKCHSVSLRWTPFLEVIHCKLNQQQFIVFHLFNYLQIIQLHFLLKKLVTEPINVALLRLYFVKYKYHQIENWALTHLWWPWLLCAMGWKKENINIPTLNHPSFSWSCLNEAVPVTVTTQTLG